MLLGIARGLLALSLLFGPGPLTLRRFLVAAAVAGLYFVTMALAPLFTGTAWVDPGSFGRLTSRPKPPSPSAGQSRSAKVCVPQNHVPFMALRFRPAIAAMSRSAIVAAVQA